MASFNENLTRLRMAANLTQEALAQAVGVSPQAVSKWENAGMPDTALLPAIADALNASIDQLFGRNPAAGDVEQAIGREIGTTPREARFGRMMALRWAMQRAYMSGHIREEDGIEALQGGEDFNYSQITADDGLSLMGLSKPLRYAFIAQEAEERSFAARLNHPEQYAELFALLAQPDACKLIFFFHTRDDNPFTASFVEKQTGIPAARVKELIPQLKRMKLVRIQSLLLDEQQVEVYYRWSNPALIPLLIFAQEISSRPTFFYCHSNDRVTPLFEEGKVQ